VQAEVEVPGTPEQVWHAIATGPGITSWFVPSEVEERVGGTALSHFAPDGSMDSVATITEWDPPRRYVAEAPDMGPESPVVATEWIVEAKSGGSCIVRVVHSWFADTDDWDAQFEGHTHGWAAFFRNLRLYLEHFFGAPPAAFQLMGAAFASPQEAWKTLSEALGLAEAETGQQVRSAPEAPLLAGTVERVGAPEWPEMLLRLTDPAPGIAHLFVLPMGGMTFVPIRLYLFGDTAPAAVAAVEPRWQAWIAEHFPVPQTPAESNA